MASNGSGPCVRLDTLTVDVDREQAGEWYALDGICEGIQVKLRSPHCDDFLRMQGHLQQQQKVFNSSGEVDTVAIDRIFRRCVGELLLVDWRGLGDEKGNKLDWSAELAADLLRKQKYRKLGAKIATLVRKISNDEEVERVKEGKDFAQASGTASM